MSERTASVISAKPIVSVLCITYNHGKYLRQTLDSFVNQETDFPFEVLIHDDASTDDTQRIINEYAVSYPNIIKPWIEKQNQYSLGNDSFVYELFRRSHGEFIAFCEGDDYWTDMNKLQRQVDLMRAHPDYSLCFHPVKVLYEVGDGPESVFPDITKVGKFTVGELLKQNYIQTNSVLYRRRSYDEMKTGVVPQDWYLHLFHVQEGGKIGWLQDTMAVYRKHPGGAWWNAQKDSDAFWSRFGLGHIRLYVELLRVFGHKPAHRTIITHHITDTMNQLTEVQARTKRPLLEAVATDFPEIIAGHVLLKRSELIKDHQEIIGVLNALRNSEHDVEQLQNRLRTITETKVWRARNKVARHIGKDPLV